MTTIVLYKYRREDGGYTVSPERSGNDYTTMYRLIADEGKMLTQDGETLYGCLDVDSVDGWYEVSSPEYDELADAVEALGILGVEDYELK